MGVITDKRRNKTTDLKALRALAAQQPPELVAARARVVDAR